MNDWKTWRPLGADDLARVQSAADAAASDFAKAWLPESNGLVCDLVAERAGVGPARQVNVVCWALGADIRVVATRTAILELARAALLAPKSFADSSDLEERVLSEVGSLQMVYLARHVAAGFGSAWLDIETAEFHQVEAAALGMGAHVEAKFRLDQHVSSISILIAASRLRADMRTAIDGGPPVVDRTLGFADLPIPVVGSVGEVALRLNELSNLAIGDVLLLNRPIDRAIDVRVARSGFVASAAFPCKTGGKVALEFCARQPEVSHAS